MGDERQADDIWRLAAGDRVDQFRVLRRLGKGGMGQVYAARDEQLGRRVALKLLTASETGTDALDEARTTAQFSHPHIVTLYAVGTYGELAYLALEYLEGETLRDRLRSGALPVQEALRLAHDIAEALKEAHRRDIQHRDLHPRNVFLGADGRLRVLDFGLSALGSPSTAEGRASGRIRGTPAYMAPEQWRGEALSPAVDVWALGLVLYELLTGTHPYAARELNSYEIRAQVLAEELRFEAPSQRREGVPRIVDDLVLECLSPEAPRRPAAAELVAQLGAMLTLSFSAPEQDPSPFKGLLTFTERDAARFYGREREVAAFVERLRKTSFLTVVGASGAGKSSFVQAGVIPRLREWGELVVVSMRPGRTPLQALVSALGTHVTAPLSGTTRSMEESELSAEVSLEGSEPESLASQLLRTPSKLSLFLQQLAERHGARAVLFVDQFEEVVTLTEDDAERSAFVKAVCLAAEDPALPVRVVLTLREEFLSRVQATMAERGGITQITVLRTPDTVDLRRILLQPVAEAQHRFDDEGVVDEMVAEASRSSACLPLLQFGGAKLWEGRDQSQRLLLRATYRDMGGLAGALAQHADQVLQAFGPDELPVGRALCLRLVTPQRTRRAVPRDELLEGLGEAGEQLLERFVAARLIVGRSGGEGPEGDLELVHESLIQTWARLAGWITQSSEELILLGELERASLGWERRGRRESDLWRGDALSDAVRSMRSFPGEVPPRVQAFLQESHDRERRVQRRTRGAVGATMLVLALAALGFARGQAEAERERGRAESERARAETGRAQVELEGARTAAERGRMVEAKAKLRASLETRDSLGGRWLWRTLRSEPRIWTLDLASTVLDVREDPLGRFVAVAVGPSVLLYDAATADGPRALAAPEMLERLAFSPGGSWLAGVTRFERTVEVWSLSGTEPLRRHLALEAPPEPGPGWSRTRLGWASDETLKVLKGAWLYTYDPRSGTLVHSEPLEKGDGVAFAVAGPLHARSDGRWLRFGGEARAPIELTSKVGNLALHPGRGRVAIGLKSGEVEVWDYVAGQRIWQTSGHARWVEELRFDASGDGLVTQAVDGVRVWRVGEPRPLESYGCEGRASGVDVDRGGDHVAIACRPGVVRRVALNVPTRDDVVVGHEAETTGPRFSPDGQYVLSGSLDRTTRLWSLSTGRNLSTPISHNSQIFNTAYGPRGRMYATAEQSGAIQLFDPQSERRLATLFGHTRGVLDLVFTADGQQLITSGQDGTLRRWSTETRTHLQTIDVGCSLYFAAVDDAGRVAASCYSEPRTVLFDAAGGARREVRRTSSSNPFVGWTRNGELLLGPDTGEIGIWGPETGLQTRARRPGADLIGFHRATGTAAVSDETGSVDLISLESEAPSVRLAGHREYTGRVAFDPPGQKVATVGWDGAVRVWDALTGQPFWRTQSFLADDALMFGHQGWIHLAEAPVRPASPSLPRELEAALVQPEVQSVGAHGSICSWDAQGNLSWWDRRGTPASFRWTGVRPREVLPVRGGCVVREDQAVRRFSPREGPETLTEGEPVYAMAWSPDGIWIATQGRLRRVGTEAVTLELTSAPTALALVGPWLAVGDETGRIDLLDPTGHSEPNRVRLEQPYLEPVTRLAGGPDETLIAGYVKGAVRVWDTRSGSQLLAAHLNGPVVHLSAQGEALLAATEVGAFGRWDLEPVRSSWCDLLEDVWETVPFTWISGAPVEIPPPASHRCRQP